MSGSPVAVVRNAIARIGKCASTGVDLSICYDTFGDKANPCICFVAGLNGQTLVWPESLCSHLAQSGYFVVRYDNRDVGLSTHLDGFPPHSMVKLMIPEWAPFSEKAAYTLDDMAEDGVRLLKELDVTKAHVIGSSMGGMIAQLVAIRYPSLVKSLTLIFTDVGGDDVISPSITTYMGFLSKPKSNSIEDLARFRYERYLAFCGKDSHGKLLYPVDEEVMMDYFRKMITRSDYSGGIIRQMGAIKRSPSRRHELEKLDVPTTVIHGAADPLIPLANGEKLASIISNAKLVIFPKMGHNQPTQLLPQIADEIMMNARLGESRQ